MTNSNRHLKYSPLEEGGGLRALGGVQVFAAGLGEFPNAGKVPGGI